MHECCLQYLPMGTRIKEDNETEEEEKQKRANM